MAQVLLGEHRYPPSTSPPHLRDSVALSSLGRCHHTCTQRRVSRNRTQTRGLCSLDAEALLSPLLFCWAWGWGGGFPMVTRHSISAIASALFLRHPETGFYCLPLVRAALSLNHLYPENITWTSQDQKWDGLSSQHPSVVVCGLLSTLPIGEAQPLPRRDRAGALHSSRSLPMAKGHMAETSQQQKGDGSSAGGCTSGHVSLCCLSDTLKALSPRRRPCRREAAWWAAAESV